MGGQGYNPSNFEKVYQKLQKSGKNTEVSLSINKRVLRAFGLDQALQERHGSDFFLLGIMATPESRSFPMRSLRCTVVWPSLPQSARWLLAAAVRSRVWT